jgi:hypothetical protein
MPPFTVQTEVPFGASIGVWLRINGLAPDELLTASHRYDQQYLAWETVRKCRNPFFENGTGFEGYLVGTCQTIEQALEQVVAVGQASLDSISRLYRFNYGFKSRLMKTLTGEYHDPKAMSEWSAQLGAAAARLRCRLLYNSQAAAFREQTYRIVGKLPGIRYFNKGQTIKQTYTLGFCGLDHVRQVSIDVGQLRPSDQDAWIVAHFIGRFGHPLVRAFVAYMDRH